MTTPHLVLLGPQRHEPIVNRALADVAPGDEPIAVITAGWEERERELEELSVHVNRPLVHLQLFERAEDVFRKDPALLSGMRQRDDRLRRLQELYGMRLDHAMQPARELLRLREQGDDPELVSLEIEDAIEAIRALDQRQEERIAEIHSAFEEQWKPGERAAVARHRDELSHAMDGTRALCIAGGNVAILLNRMRLFDIGRFLEDRPVIAWSAGAMALGKRVVLFHDSPPQGPGNAEVFEHGACLFDDIVPLPHASTRLQLEDPSRVSLFASRFSPAQAITLDAQERLDRVDGKWKAIRTRRLETAGSVSAMEVA